MVFENAAYVVPATGGELDFFYQIQNNSPNPSVAIPAGSNVVTSKVVLDLGTLTSPSEITGIAQIENGNFVPFTAGNFNSPTTGFKITSVSLDSTDEFLTVNLSSNVGPGQNSAILVVETDSTTFDQDGEGDFSWKAAPKAPPGYTLKSSTGSSQDYDLDALEPILAPEPGVYGVLTLAIGGLLFFVRRRSEQAKLEA